MIRTDRLLLRRWGESDRAGHAALNADPAVMEHFQGTQTPEGSHAFIDKVERHWDEHGWGLWALEVRGSVGQARGSIRSSIVRPVRTPDAA